MLCYVECRYAAECCNADRRYVIMLSVIMLCVVKPIVSMLSVIMLCVVMLSVMALIILS